MVGYHYPLCHSRVGYIVELAYRILDSCCNSCASVFFVRLFIFLQIQTCPLHTTILTPNNYSVFSEYGSYTTYNNPIPCIFAYKLLHVLYFVNNHLCCTWQDLSTCMYNILFIKHVHRYVDLACAFIGY